MQRSNAGKARISIVWMVTAVVLFLVAAFYAFVAQSALADERVALATERAKAEEQRTEVARLEDERASISRMLGFYDRQNGEFTSKPDEAKAALENLKTTFPDLGAAEPDFETSIPKIVAAFDERSRKIAELETRIKGLESEVAAAQAASAQVATEKDTTIASLRQEIADEQKNAEQRVAELESRIEQGRTLLSERDSEVRKARDDAGAEKRRFEAQKAIDDARIGQLAQDTKFASVPYANEPDGSVLEVSDRLGTGWIDIGANKRVVPGIVFEIRGGRGGAVKAYAEVTSVKPNSAEVQFSGVVDRFNPPVAGDLISNRLFDPVGGRNAVLIGRFSGSHNENDLKALLAKMGIQVQASVDRTTHFLIVGSELWSDPATGEPLADPIQPSDLPEYKQAESLGVQIVPLQDIRDHFRLGVGQ